MGATGWRTTIVIASLSVSLVAAMLVASAFVSMILLFGLFLAGCALSQLVFNRLASADDICRDLEDRVRDPPS